ncbi:MAG TPA: DUF6265 family protein [Gemmatimonadales bacterium]|nr:DUF6265 family protein [Gemmatimonadales bacterium]
MITRAGIPLIALGLTTLSSRPPQARPIDRVGWLQGCWIQTSPQRTIEEHWMPPRGNSMIGMGRTVRGDSLVEFEVVVVRERGSDLVYEAHPSGQPSAEFVAESLGVASVLFANPAHDFPQRVGYRRVSADSLVGWIEGTMGGQNRRIEFPYRRTACYMRK